MNLFWLCFYKMNLNAKFAIARYNTTYIVYRHLYAILQILHMFSKKEEVKSIGNPAGIGKGTGFGLRDRDRDGIGLGHYRLRASINFANHWWFFDSSKFVSSARSAARSSRMDKFIPKAMIRMAQPISKSLKKYPSRDVRLATFQVSWIEGDK